MVLKEQNLGLLLNYKSYLNKVELKINVSTKMIDHM